MYLDFPMILQHELDACFRMLKEDKLEFTALKAQVAAIAQFITNQDFDALAYKAYRLRVRKAVDYQHGVKLEEYFPFGDTSYRQMLWVKLKRIQSLYGMPIQNEPLADTALDMLNYLHFYEGYLNGCNDANPC